MSAVRLTREEWEVVDQVKGAIFEGISTNLRARYAQQLDACAELDIDPPTMSAIMNHNMGRFSISYLCRLAHRMGLTVTVKVS